MNYKHFCGKIPQAFPHSLPTGKFDDNALRDTPTSPTQYFNQRLLNFTQSFASDADYVILARSVYEQRHLGSSINFTIQKIKLGTFTAEVFKMIFKRNASNVSYN